MDRINLKPTCSTVGRGCFQIATISWRRYLPHGCLFGRGLSENATPPQRHAAVKQRNSEAVKLWSSDSDARGTVCELSQKKCPRQLGGGFFWCHCNAVFCCWSVLLFCILFNFFHTAVRYSTCHWQTNLLFTDKLIIFAWISQYSQFTFLQSVSRYVNFFGLNSEILSKLRD